MSNTHLTPPAAIPALAFPALILANIILAFGPVLVRMADVGPVAAGFWRLALAVPFLLFMARSGLRGLKLRPMQWAMISLAGLFFAADLASWHVGILFTKVANSTIFGNFSALALPIWGMVVLRHKAHRIQIVALSLAAIGAGILMGGSYELSPRYLRGDMLCLLAGLFYTFYLLVIQDARQRMDSWSVLALASLAGVFPLLGFAYAMGEQIVPQNWTPVIALALSSQIFGQGLMTYAIGWFSPLVIGLSLMLQPAIAALSGWLLFGETMTLVDGVGALLVAIALIIVRLPAR